MDGVLVAAKWFANCFLCTFSWSLTATVATPMVKKNHPEKI
jgi:hypothetical protein